MAKVKKGAVTKKVAKKVGVASKQVKNKATARPKALTAADFYEVRGLDGDESPEVFARQFNYTHGSALRSDEAIDDLTEWMTKQNRSLLSRKQWNELVTRDLSDAFRYVYPDFDREVFFNACAQRSVKDIVEHYTSAVTPEHRARQVISFSKLVLNMQLSFNVVNRMTNSDIWTTVSHLKVNKPSCMHLFLIHAFVNSANEQVCRRATHGLYLGGYSRDQTTESFVSDMGVLASEDSWITTLNFLKQELVPCVESLIERKDLRADLTVYYQTFVDKMGDVEFRKAVEGFTFRDYWNYRTEFLALVSELGMLKDSSLN